jgi:hypothetical protein
MRASGLFGAKEQADGGTGQLYSRFRKRITFPIANEQGRVIAFTARALDSDEKSGPKYMNSPETALYSKGQVLFNLDKAKAGIRQLEFALLVEGQMDCISVYMAGCAQCAGHLRHRFYGDAGAPAQALYQAGDCELRSLTPPARTPPRNPLRCSPRRVSTCA